MQQQTYIQIKNEQISIVIKSYRTSKHLKIYFKANVLYLSKPQYVSVKRAMEYVEMHKDEIYKMYIKLKDSEDTKTKKWVNGETFPIKGEEYVIDIQKIHNANEINLRIDNNKKEVHISYPDNLSEESKKYNIDKGIKQLLKNQTNMLLHEKVPYWSKVTNIPYKLFKVNDATSRYGSCVPSTNILHFSSRLIMLPEDKIDAVVVHELCHMVYSNHSKDFYNLVRKYIPNYDEINKWLKKNGKIILF